MSQRIRFAALGKQGGADKAALITRGGKMKNAVILAFLLLLGSMVLGATVLREPIAKAATPFMNVIVGNTAANPVPTREQNLDANGNIKVHEQGIANVSVAAQAPITAGGNAFTTAAQSFGEVALGETAAATALSIHLDAGVNYLVLLNGTQRAALFDGPANQGNSSIVLALARPIQFDHYVCNGSGYCSVSWIGNQP